MILETERLLLREMCQADFESLCKILQDEETMYAYEGAFSDAEAQEWLDRQISCYKRWGLGLWAVVLKDTGEMIGQCGLTIQPWKGRELLEAGCLLQRAYYAVEAAGACFRNAECQRGLFHHQRHQHRVAEGGPSQRHDPNGCLDKTLPRREYAASPLYSLSYLAAMHTGKRRNRLGCGASLCPRPA